MNTLNSCRIIAVDDYSDAFLMSSQKPYVPTEVLSSDGCNLIINKIDIRFKVEFCFQINCDKVQGQAEIHLDEEDRDIFIHCDEPLMNAHEMNNHLKLLIEDYFKLSGQDLFEEYNSSMTI